MFGRSTTSRFVKDKKDSVPGPGEYDARAVGTTKRGAGMGSGARMSLMPAAEGAHLGPGAYGVPGETMLGPHSARGGALRGCAVDYDAALKKLQTSFARVLGDGGPGAKKVDLTREDICAMASKLIADASMACSDSLKLKGDLDAINKRVSDEVNAVLKPNKAKGIEGCPAAWKTYQPLEKAVTSSSSDLEKKLNKMCSLLTLLHEDFPALAGVMSDGDRIGQLTHAVQTLESDLDEAMRQSSSAAEAADQAKHELQTELEAYKRRVMQQEVRADKLEDLLLSQKQMVLSLEAQLESSFSHQEALYVQLMAKTPQDGADSIGGDQDGAYQRVVDECQQARDAHDRTLQELQALNVQMTNVMAQNEADKVALEEQMLAAADEALHEASGMLSELDQCRDMLLQSQRDKRIVRATVVALEQKRHALRSTLAAGAAELATLHAYMDSLSPSKYECLRASPERLCGEAQKAVAGLDQSLSDDLLATQTKVEELTEALEVSEAALADAQVELSQLQQEVVKRTELAHEKDGEALSEIDSLIHSHAEVEEGLRSDLQQKESLVSDLTQQLHDTREDRDRMAARAAELEGALAQVTSEYETHVNTTAAEKASKAVAFDVLAQQLQAAVAQHSKDNAALEAELAKTIAKYEAHLSCKTAEVEAVSQEIQEMGAMTQAVRDKANERLSLLVAKLAQVVAQKQQTEAILSSTQDEFRTYSASTEAVKHADEAQIAVLEAERDELGCVRMQHEETIAELEGKIASAQGLLEQKQSALQTAESEVDVATGEVEHLTGMKALHEERVAELEMQRETLERELAQTEVDFAEATRLLGDQIAASEGEAAEIARVRDAHVETIAGLETQLGSTEDELAQTKARLTETTARLTAQLAESEDAVAQLTTLKAQHQTHIAALELQVAESLEALRSTKAALEANVEQLAGELAAEQKQTAATTTALSAANAQNEASTLRVGQLEDSVAAAMAQLAESQRERAHLQDQLLATAEQLQADMQQVTAEVHAMQRAAIDKMQTALQSQHADARAQEQAAAAHLARVQAAHAEQLAVLTDDRDERAAAMDKMREEISALQDQLDDQLAITNTQKEELAQAAHEFAAAAEAAAQQLSATQVEHAESLQELERAHASEQAAAAQRAAQELEAAKAHAADVKTQLAAKISELEADFAFINASLETARADHQKASEEAEAKAAAKAKELEDAAAKISMLESALQGTEQDRAQALAAISNMYEHTDKQLKAMATGAGGGAPADAGALARMATLQAELESSMMERAEALAELQSLQTSAREAAAEALRHRQALEAVEAEKKALSDRLALLESDNAKLSEENIKLVGHSNLKQRISIFDSVKNENNALKKEKADAEKLVSQQRKVIERLEKNTTGADKENSGARLFAKIDQEERLQAALKDSEGEARALRKHLLTLMHHVHTSLGQADLGEGFAVNALPQGEVGKEILCDSNKGFKQRDWNQDVKQTECMIDALTTHVQQQHREVAGAHLKIHLLEQSARILRPSATA